MAQKYETLEDPRGGELTCGCDKDCKANVPKLVGEAQCHDHIAYYLNTRRAPVTDELPDDDAYEALFRETLDIVEATCGVRFVQVYDLDKAIVEINFGSTSGSVLAWSNVGFSCSGGAEQLYGTKWNWTKDFLRTVILHEVGHLLGLPHDQCVNRGNEHNVMCWQIREYLDEYDSVTASKLKDIYGPPIDGPKPEPEPKPEPKPEPEPEPDDDFEWPFPLYPGEPLRNIVRVVLNLLWYFTIHQIFKKR